MESRNKKTLYISNLPNNVTEEDLKSIFENFGVCVSCELCLETYSAYFEFENETSADKALAMNNVDMGESQVQVVVAFKDTSLEEGQTAYTLALENIDYSKAVQIFVGDIGFDVDEAVLEEGFSKFGKILEVKVVRMPDGKHRGYAFISFSSETEANNAIEMMNNTMFHNRNIKCNWATKSKNANGNAAGNNRKYQQHPMKSLQDISMETPPSNTSVYVTGENLVEEILRPCFERFGKIKNIKAYPEKNHAFVNFEAHDAAANAIFQLNGYNVSNTTLKCNWGKKNSAGYNSDRRMMDSFYPNNQQHYYDNSQAHFGNNGNTMQQYEQYYHANYQVPPFQQQQQFYNNSQMLDYYSNVQMQNYPPQQQQQQQHQYPNNFNARQQKSINAQSYPYYAAYNSNSQQYNMYQ